MTADRTHDLVLLGATGFTGGLTARYLAAHAPVGLRWALAGRNETALTGIRAELATIDPGLAELPLVTADVTDQDSMQALARSSRVVASTVGPYIHFGEPLVGACAEAGTDYLDLTGEPEFVDLMYARYHRAALTSGARLVHSCGFDSIPHDLGVLYTVAQLPDDVAITVDGVVRAGGRLSSGTLRSAIEAFGRIRSGRAAAAERHTLEARGTDGRRARAAATPPRHQDGLWLLPLPTIDPQVVTRSARALSVYGPDFTYHHYAGVRRLPTVLAAAAGLTAVLGVAQVPPARRLLLSRIHPGDGPSPEQRARGWFSVRFTARAAGRTLVTEVRGGDPGYDETATMLAEAAMCLALDDVPSSSGQVTTAQAMGTALIDRLVRAGITFRTVSDTAQDADPALDDTASNEDPRT